MTTAVTTLRSTLATALANAGIWSVFAFSPATPIADSVTIDADDPYLTISNGVPDLLGPLAHFKVRMYVPALDNQGSLGAIETMIVAVWNKLASSGLSIRSASVNVGSFSGQSGELTAGEISIAILTSWS